MQPLINRRTLIAGSAGLALVGVASLTGFKLRKQQPQEILKENLLAFSDNLHRELGLGGAPNQVKGVSLKESDKIMNDFFTLVKNFQLEHDPQSNLDINDPAQRVLNTQQYLLNMGIVFTPYHLAGPLNMQLPLIRLYEAKVVPAVDSNSASYNQYLISKEISKPVSPEFFPEATAMALCFKDGRNAIITNEAQIKRDLELFKRIGLIVDPQEYAKCLIENEVASIEFAQRFKAKFQKIQKIQLAKSDKKGFDYLQVNEAYGDMKSFKPDSSFPVQVLRIIKSPLEHYLMSKALMLTAIRSYNLKHQGSTVEQLDLREPEKLALKLAREPELCRRLHESVMEIYTYIFNKKVIPEIEASF